MPPAGILHTEMDEETLLELEIQQDLERIDLDDGQVIADDDDVEINNNEVLPINGEDAVPGSDDEGVPAELLDYISTIQKQRQRFEEELEECDTLIDSTIASARGERSGGKAVVVYDEWKELEEEAARLGMTAEEYRKKLLQDIEDEPFELEEMDFISDESEFKLPDTHLDLLLKETAATESSTQLVKYSLQAGDDEEPNEEEEMIEKALKIAHALEASQRQEAEKEGGRQGSSETPENGVTVMGVGEEGADSGQLVPVAPQPHCEDDPDTARNSDQAPDATGKDNDRNDGGHTDTGPDEANKADGETAGSVVPFESDADNTKNLTEGSENTVAVLHANHLLEFEQYLREQFQLAEERFRQREEQLKRELEGRREVEEKLMLAMEEQKLQTLQTLQEEEQRLAKQKQESQKRLDQEVDQRQKVLEEELRQHEKSIATLTAQLEEDRYQLEKVQRAEEERLVQRCERAALTIQRCYKGHRVRQLHQTERQTLAVKKEQRKEEKTQQRIEEIEQQIQKRKEEEERKTEEAKREKEEQERKKEEEKRKREEEKRLKKEEEERKKREEEDRKRKAEEEKKRKKEEEKRLKEEQERKKKEEKERKKREEEERKQKEAEEKKQKAEEERKRKEEEEQRKKEEEERQQKKEEEEKKRKEEELRKEEEEEKQKKAEIEKQKRDDDKEEEQQKQHMAENKQNETIPQQQEKKPEATESILQKTEEKPAKNQTSKENHNTDESIPEEERYRSDNSHKIATDSKPKTDVSNRNSEPQDGESGYAVSPVVLDLEPVNANLLPSSLEERRLAWMKSCLPWSKISNEPWKLKSAPTEKAPRRPASAKKLPPFPDSAVLEAAKVASLRQVTTVELKDLPGHALTPLGTCAHLKHLTVRRCGLIALDGLSQCRHLQCIDVQDNLIEYVDLKELGSLYTLNLSHNKLASIHGMEGCNNLRWLDVSHNRLTKLGGLSPLRRLHTLQASHNQLVTTQGLGASCPTLQHLDLAANYLTSLPGLGKLALLTTLNAASNNLTQMPSLENNILLQELVLRENSIGPDLDLSAAWLPLLFNLDLSQNIIEELKGSAAGLFVLKRLDLAVNQITDISSFLPALSDSPRLENLSLQGNAVLDEENLRENVKNSIASLLCLNGETLRSQASVASAAAAAAGHPVRCFELLCITQLQLHRELKIAFDKECRSFPDKGKTEKHHVCDTYFQFCDRSFKLAVEHRFTHEYGELSSSSSTNIPNPPQTPRSHRPPSARTPRVVGQTRSSVPDSATDRNSETTTASSLQKSEACSPSAHAPVSTSEKAGALTAVAAVAAERNGEAEERKASLSPVLSQREKFELALKAEASRSTAGRGDPGMLPTKRGDEWSVQGPSLGEEGWRRRRVQREEEEERPRASVQGAGDAERPPVREAPEQKPQLSAKEKFERALAGLPTTPPSPLPPVEAPPSFLQKDHGLSGAVVTENKSEITVKKPGGGITADRVGDLMMAEIAGVSRSAFPNKFPDDGDELDDLEAMMEGLHFDIDGFLDLDQFDFDEDFLEKGWRPEDTPQMPQNYPVLARIPSSSAKPPLPPLHATTTHTTTPPPPPHGRPSLAWRSAESPLGDVQTRVPPLLRPPSSVGSGGEDSQAVTTGRSRKEERLAEEWGFKDSRTAELMMQRANKMKYNAERRRKLSKLDPQQRLRLFRKLEEVKGVRTVRPPPPRVLPRKEYFQAREDEALQRDLEKQVEHRTKAGRTFEWLHTQVGEYEVSSSRINPGAGGGAGNSLVKTASDSQLSHHASPPLHGYSPVSMDIESVSSLSHHQNAGRQQRHSLPSEDLALTGHSPMLPPIKTGSASSQPSRERERMSWRTEPAEKNVGWGGGKKRQVRK